MYTCLVHLSGAPGMVWSYRVLSCLVLFGARPHAQIDKGGGSALERAVFGMGEEMRADVNQVRRDMAELREVRAVDQPYRCKSVISNKIPSRSIPYVPPIGVDLFRSIPYVPPIVGLLISGTRGVGGMEGMR